MKKEKIKHMALIILAVCLIGIGYMNYDYNSTLEVASIDNAVDESTLRRCRISKCKRSKRGNCAK